MTLGSLPRRVILGVGVLALAPSCCPPRIEYRKVEIPIAVPVKDPPEIPWPDLPIYHLEKGASEESVARAYAMSVAILRERLYTALRNLDAYRSQSTPSILMPLQTNK